MNMLPNEPSAASLHMFDEIVCLKFESAWCYIESGKQALECLGDRFPDQGDPSWQRAHSTCAACVADQVGVDAAKSAFIVAAMAAGIAFEVADNFSVLERHVEEAATDGLMTILFDDEDGTT